MKGPYYSFLGLLCIILTTGSIFAQSENFYRKAEIQVPALENTGFGNIIAGVDFDGDGKPEIYAVNNMLDQGGAELTPRIYKFEYNGSTWDSVWSASIPDIHQNSWGALTYGDLDGDGKPEIIWAPSNNLDQTSGPNPYRIYVYEYPGDGSDAMGISSFGDYLPNAKWQITDQDNEEVRPFRMVVSDVDGDGKPEIVFCDREPNYRFGVVSVSDIPDNGDGSETWTLKASGLGSTLDAGTIYDLAVIGNMIYLIHDDGVVTPVKYENGAYSILAGIPDMVPGGSWKSACVTDINGDGQKEIVVGGWSPGYNKVYLLQPDAFSILTSTQIANITPYTGSEGRLNGGDEGDIDGDGKADFVFGTRSTTPLASIVRVSYQGGDIADSNSYKVSIIDSLYPGQDYQRYDVVRVAKVGGNANEQVLYTDGNQTGRIPIVILDLKSATAVEKTPLPETFFLDQNYPNPFNPSTTIRFGVPKESAVSLEIYNTLGQKVANILQNVLKPAGTYDVTFNASRLPSGTYIYRLQVDNRVIAKKMVLMK